MRDAQPPSGLTSEAGVPRILIVDDVADNREILARRFRKRGFDIVEAGGGIEALKHIAAGEFDLVFLDILMPDLDGYEVLKSIRQRPALADMPIIMVTAKTGSDDVVKALTLGANDFVTKPVDFAIVTARADLHLAQRRSVKSVRAAAESLKTKNRELVRRIEESEGAKQKLQDKVDELQPPLARHALLR